MRCRSTGDVAFLIWLFEFELMPFAIFHFHFRLSEEKSPSRTHRTLIIHAGGQSKRLTTCSALGKIFAPVPTTLRTFGIPFQAATFDILIALTIPLGKTGVE